MPVSVERQRLLLPLFRLFFVPLPPPLLVLRRFLASLGRAYVLPLLLFVAEDPANRGLGFSSSRVLSVMMIGFLSLISVRTSLCGREEEEPCQVFCRCLEDTAFTHVYVSAHFMYWMKFTVVRRAASGQRVGVEGSLALFLFALFLFL